LGGVAKGKKRPESFSGVQEGNKGGGGQCGNCVGGAGPGGRNDKSRDSF